MAYVGCIAGAIAIEDYRAGLVAAGFGSVEVVDDRADLNAYARVDGQSACCSPSMSTSGLAVVDAGCCAPGPAAEGLHSRLADLLARYDVNDYAASVKVYAVKPG